jgi:transcription elongation factor GreA
MTLSGLAFPWKECILTHWIKYERGLEAACVLFLDKELHMADKLPMSQAAYDKLLLDIEKLKKVDRPWIISEIATARAQGDLSENAEYHAAKEKQGMIEDKIQELDDRIARAEVMTLDPAASPHVIFGATVSVKNLATSKTLEYTLVGSEEVDALAGKISSASPIGQALMSKKTGDVVEVNIPKGLLKLEILGYR